MQYVNQQRFAGIGLFALASLGLLITACSDNGNKDTCTSGLVYSNMPCANGAGTQTEACIQGTLYPTSACVNDTGETIVDQTDSAACTPAAEGATRAIECQDATGTGLKPQICTKGSWQGEDCVHGPDGTGFHDVGTPPKDDGEDPPKEDEEPPTDVKNNCTTFTEIAAYDYGDGGTIDGCFDVNQNISISSDVTIAAGTTLRFAEETGLTVDGNGSLSAVGTADALIVFKGQKDIAGFWSGITFYNSHAIANTLDYVVIDGGGYLNADDGGGLNLMTCCGGTTTLAVTNTTITNGGHYGIRGEGGVSFTTFKNNDLSGNKKGPMAIAASTIVSLDDATNYGDPATDRIVVHSKGIGAGTIPAANVPYLLMDGLGFGEGNETLTIAPGAVLEFAQGKSMDIADGAIIDAAGTSEKPIILRGEKPSAGYWKGMIIYNTDKQENLLNYVTIQDGGKDGGANLSLTECCGGQTSVTLKHVTLKNSGGDAIYLESNASVTACEDVNFTAANVGGENQTVIDQVISACSL